MTVASPLIGPPLRGIPGKSSIGRWIGRDVRDPPGGGAWGTSCTMAVFLFYSDEFPISSSKND